LSYHTKLDQEESDADQPSISYMDSANSGIATEAKDHPSENLRLAASGDPPEPIGDLEQDCRQDPRRSEAAEYGF
jgi:hypothetical protein